MQANGRAALGLAAVLAAADAIAVRRAWSPGLERVLVWLTLACVAFAAVLAVWVYQAVLARWLGDRPWARALLAGLPLGLIAGLRLGRTHSAQHYAGAWAAPLACAATIALAAALCRAIAVKETSRRRLWAGALAACGLTILAGVALRRPNVNFVARVQAPVSRLVLHTVTPAPAPHEGTARARPVASRAAPYPTANLVLITVDAQRADQPLPALDAASGSEVRFTRVYAQAPHTAWSVTSLLTGAHPDRLRSAAPPPTLADRLRARHFCTDAFYPAGLFFDGRAPLERYAATRFGFEWTDTRTLDAHALTSAILDRVAEERRAWIDEPRFFLWAHYFDPHEPYVAHEGVAADAPARDRYAGEVAFVDRELPRLVAGLSKLARPTVVVVTADHGEEFGEHGGAYHGTTLYEEQVRVPLRMFVVGGTPLPARDIDGDGAAELVDVAPTLLALLGIDGDPEGRSLAAQLDGAPLTGRDAHAQVDSKRMLVRDGWKLIHDLRGDVRQLYDLARDPSEQRNLAGSEPARTQALDDALAAWFELPPPEALAATLADEHAPVGDRVAAARALAAGQPWIADVSLGHALSAADPAVRAEAALGLAELSDDAARAPLLAMLDDPRLRRRAALGLGHLRDPRAVPALREALADIDPTVRRHAVHYLGWLAGPADATLLRERAVADLKIRADAYLALGRLYARTGAPGVRAFLGERLTVEEYDDARSRLGEALRLAAARPVTNAAN